MNNETFLHVIKDPVHGTMQFTATENNWVKPFINSPSFQRLRHIKQLGMGDFIFPGAVHSRFNHCLGCCYVASQIAHKIGLAEEERQLVMIACLLHDIGHGPFSHTFEDIFQKKLIRHETWTPFFLAEFRQGNFFKDYNRQNPRFHLTEEKFLAIEEMIMHKFSIKPVLADIVSSQLDADRLDYLLRDSHFCGAAYGQYDFSWMLNSMMIVNSEKGERLGLTHKGIGVVEHYLMARRLMIRNIYYHYKKLALEHLLVKLLAALAESLENYSPFSDLKNTRLGKFLLAVNQFNQEVSATKNIELSKQQFLQNNFSSYKELSDYDIFSVIKSLAAMPENHTAIQIAKRLHYRQIPKIIRIDPVDLVRTKNLLLEFKNTHQKQIPSWQLELFETPHQSYSIDDDPILITNENGQVKPLNETSLMIHVISDKYEQTAFLCVDREIIHLESVQFFIKNLTQAAQVTV